MQHEDGRALAGAEGVHPAVAEVDVNALEPVHPAHPALSSARTMTIRAAADTKQSPAKAYAISGK